MRSVISRANRGSELAARGAQLAGAANIENMPPVNRALVQAVENLLTFSEVNAGGGDATAQLLRTSLRTLRHIMPVFRESVAKMPPDAVAEVVRSVLENFRPLLEAGVLELPSAPTADPVPLDQGEGTSPNGVDNEAVSVFDLPG